MARSARRNHRLSSHQFRPTPYRLNSPRQRFFKKEDQRQKPSKTMQKEDWEGATCSVCMEFPHNAVLLLCSSHDKGCRPYMCGTSYRYSNCLDLYKKAYTKVLSPQRQDHGPGVSGWPVTEKSEGTELACPLCRGQVKGWTVVEPAREYLNSKRRGCVQDNCSFSGTYRELRKHMRAEHPLAKPRKVDPTLEQKWRSLEREREQEDVMSVIRSSMPGAVVWGDYVIESGNNGAVTDDDEGDVDRDGSNGAIRGGFDPNYLSFYFLLRAYEDSRSASFASRLRRAARRSGALEAEEGGHHHFFLTENVANHAVAAGDSEGDEAEAPVIGTRQGRGMGRSERRRRRRRNISSSRGLPSIDISMT